MKEDIVFSELPDSIFALKVNMSTINCVTYAVSSDVECRIQTLIREMTMLCPMRTKHMG